MNAQMMMRYVASLWATRKPVDFEAKRKNVLKRTRQSRELSPRHHHVAGGFGYRELRDRRLMIPNLNFGAQSQQTTVSYSQEMRCQTICHAARKTAYIWHVVRLWRERNAKIGKEKKKEADENENNKNRPEVYEQTWLVLMASSSVFPAGMSCVGTSLM